MIPNPLLAFDALMQETPYSHFDSGCEGITPECRTCRIIAHSGGTRHACLNTAHTPQSRFPPVGIASLQKRSDDMGVFRVNKNKNYTVMSNVHLRDKALPLKAKGLLSLMLSLPEDWDYSMRGLAKLSADGLDSTRAAVKALERSGYVVRRQLYDSRGRFF